jgi:hypothetical protein
MSDTPRTDEADKFVTYTNKLDGKAYATEWVMHHLLKIWRLS